MLKFKQKKARDLDPLYLIFETHLENFKANFEEGELDRKTFILKIVKDYLGYLRKSKLSIPKQQESEIFEELAYQVNSMLVKKIYGCLSIREYQKKKQQKQDSRVRNRYSHILKNLKQITRKL